MRDRRNPKILGQMLLDMRKRYPKKKLSDIYDEKIAGLTIAEYYSVAMSNNPAEHHSKTQQDHLPNHPNYKGDNADSNIS